MVTTDTIIAKCSTTNTVVTICFFYFLPSAVCVHVTVGVLGQELSRRTVVQQCVDPRFGDAKQVGTVKYNCRQNSIKK